jgi:LEA14-like dessication related protein
MKRIGVLLAGCLLSACAALVPKLEPPQLTVTRVDLVGGNLQQQQVHLTLHVVNPNARAIDVRGIDCNLDLNGDAFAAGSTEAAFTLPASGETDFGLNVTAHLDSALMALLSGFGQRTVDYRMYGQVHLSTGLMRNIPFEQKGRVKL